MLISKKWLEQYFPNGIPLSNLELRDRVTKSLAEVEDIVGVGESLKGIIAGEIKEIKPHPNASKIQIAIVDTGEKRKRTIICGAKNIFKGAKVPVALPGGQVLNYKDDLNNQRPVTIKAAKIKGVRSQGMLCSKKELGIGEDHTGIWILPKEVKTGNDIVEILSDTVLEIENKSLTHRPDCFSHRGIAREVATILRTSIQYQQDDEPLKPTQTLPLVVKVEDQKLCKRYTAIAIQGVNVTTSPLWLQQKLLAVGVRPINNIVDATNYVMLDLGQPLHAFDYNKLEAPRVIVRTAKNQEKTTTLDQQERELKSTHLCICDPAGPIGIAGIMGGANSEISRNTQDIIIESANFEMYNIRRTARELGLRSEASIRFEKGLDPNLTLEALRRVVKIITEIAEGEIASEVIDIYPNPVEEKELELDISDVPRLLGIELSKQEIVDIFTSLELKVLSPESSTTQVKVKAPTFRQDLVIKEDLLEEIGRIYGYDKFNPTLPTRTLTPVKVNKQREFEKILKSTLSSIGFDELYTYSFVGKEIYDKTLLNIENCMKLKNPLSPELGFMRNSHIPSLLEKVYTNIPYFDKIAIYEIAKIYLKRKSEEGLPTQPKMITALISKEGSEMDLFYEMKGYIEQLIKLGMNINNTKLNFNKIDSYKYLHPDLQSNIKIGNTVIGHMGNIHPSVKSNWNIKLNTAFFELKFDNIFKHAKSQNIYKRIPKYPQVKRDLSFWIDKKISADFIQKSLEKKKTSFITDIEIIDIFTSSKKRGVKSVTITITLQSGKKTLTEKDIQSDINILIKSIRKIGGELRK